MRKTLSFLAIVLVSASAFAAAPNATPSRSGTSTPWGSAQRATASKNQISAGVALTANQSSIKAETPSAAIPVDKRDKEKQACINNNIGMGNTFVWASRYSNTNNYASMVEDVENPENNVCFVKIELKSDDAKIKVSDVAPVYYEMGRNITCGSWADEGKLKSRILDAKKSARTWGTVAGSVGGAGVGVGIMELFGNRLIGGAVMGQKALSENELVRSQVAVLKDKDNASYQRLKLDLLTLKTECDKNIWAEAGVEKPAECTTIPYDALLSL